MCIIISKNKDNRIPTIDELTNCFENNPDGAGFMYVKNGKVIIDKGYMTKDAFINRYKKLLKDNNNFKNKSLVIHCRIGTGGTNSKKNTHPYPITNDINKLHSTFIVDNIGIAHNGIISDYNIKDGDNKQDINDTQNFIKSYLYDLYIHFRDFYKYDNILKSIKYLTNSKFAILTKNDNVYNIGDFVLDNNLYFSNTTYNYKSYNYTYNYDYKYYNDYYTSYSGYQYKYNDNKSYIEKRDDTPRLITTDKKIPNYEYCDIIPINYFIEYDNKIIKLTSKDNYIIDYSTGNVFKLNDDTNDYDFITDDYILYNDKKEVATW